MSNELGKYSFLKNTQSTYIKISQKEIFEFSSEGFFHKYKENQINTGENISKKFLANKIQNNLNEFKDNKIKFNNLKNAFQ